MTSSVSQLLGQLSDSVLNSTLQQTRGELFTLLHTDGSDVRTYLRSMRGKTDALDALITEIMCRVLRDKVNAENALEKLARDETILRRDIMAIGEALAGEMQRLIADARDESVRLAYASRESLEQERQQALQAENSYLYFWEVILSIVGVALGVLMISMA